MITASKQVEKARTALTIEKCFYASIALGWEVIADDACETLWVDGKRMGYNPDFVDSQPPNKVKGSVAHEVKHCTNLHHLRRPPHVPNDIWNMACDYVINPELIREGFELPDGFLIDARFDGMSAEQIAGVLMKEQPQQQPQDEPESDDESDDAGDGDSGQQGASDEASDDDSDDGTGESDDGEGDDAGETGKSGTENGQTSPSGGTSGPNSDDQGQSGDGTPETGGSGSGEAAGDPGQCGEIRDATNDDGTELSEAEKKAAEDDMRVKVVQAAQQAKAWGQMPADLERELEDLLDPKMDVAERLREFVQTAAKNDFRFLPPNRRYIDQDMYLPSLRSDELDKIVLLIDTSGSISMPVLTNFAENLTGILEEYTDCTAHVVYIDSRVCGSEEFTHEDLPLEIHPRGGGGTDFRPGFDWVEENDIEPTCLIYLTDGYCESFPDEPDYPVLWAIYGREREVPFGEVLMLTE